MSYLVKELFYTLQGEGARTGRPAVFCRFSGCNLWTGRERHRHVAVCQFCDTDFVGTDGPGGGRFDTAADLAAAAAGAWSGRPSPAARPYVVCTGGEPLLQLDAPLVAALHEHGFEVAVETNGTRPLTEGLDWVCVSPKSGAPLVVERGDELKLVYPQDGLAPEDVAGLGFDRFFLQPMDGPMRAENTKAAVEYCLEHPQWRLSLQTHKVLGIP
ncbi:MAG TPA: 7-carboxy-7-deazaguanine synthase [Acidimicrobiales bacterium]|nr:7-carboxy-7-deazaguanine synthase [Acidimicrobiales bacterium]